MESKDNKLPQDRLARAEERGNPDVLFLSPVCHELGDGRTWCATTDGDPCYCVDEGLRSEQHPFVKYVRADATVQSEDTPASYTPATDDEVKLALDAYHDSEECNTDEVNMKAALDSVLYRRGSTVQPQGHPQGCECGGFDRHGSHDAGEYVGYCAKPPVQAQPQGDGFADEWIEAAPFKPYYPNGGEDGPLFDYDQMRAAYNAGRASFQVEDHAHIMQRVKDVADGTIDFNDDGSIREVAHWMLTGEHEAALNG